MQVVGTLTDAMKRGLTRKAIDSVEMLRSSLTTIEMDELQRELRDETYRPTSPLSTKASWAPNFTSFAAAVWM